MRIIYFDVDTLRPDHTEPYGYKRRITPNLREFAQSAVTFDRAYCSDAPCVPSRAALTACQFGITNGVVAHFGKAAQFRFNGAKDQAEHYMHPPHRPLLGGHLSRELGMYTASVSCFAERHLAYWFCGNFRENVRPSWSLGQDEDAQDVNSAAVDWLGRHGHEDNWFLHLNYWEPHTRYIESMEWVKKAADAGPAPDWPDEDAIALHQKVYGPHTAADLTYLEGGASPRPEVFPEAISGRRDFETLVNGYDGEVCYWDYHFGQLLNHLSDLGILDDTVIIVSADHGECLGENGSYAEHGLANDAVNRIPLLVRWPGVTDAGSFPGAARRSDAMVYNIDLGPTLCDMLGIPIPEGWQGESFAAAIRGAEFGGRPYLVLGQGAHTFQRAVRTRDHLYVHTLHPGCMKVPTDQLYDMAADPHMMANIHSEGSSISRDMQAKLLEWWQRYAGSEGAPPDPMQMALGEGPVLYAKPAAYAHHLEVIGRKADAKELRQRLGI